MAKGKKEYVKYTTPIGEAGFCAIVEPSTKFKAEGVYQVKFFVKESDASDLLKKLNAVHAAAVADGKAKWEKEKPEIRRKNQFKENPYFDYEYDSDEVITGRISFNFKHNAAGTSKQTGKDWTFKLPLYDDKGKPIENTKDLRVYGGSLLRVSFSASPYYVAATGCGISLQLEAVQILKAVSGGGRSAASYGFTAVDGYGDDESGIDDSSDESSFGSSESGDDVDF